jgi:hypothetical protein
MANTIRRVAFRVWCLLLLLILTIPEIPPCHAAPRCHSCRAWNADEALYCVRCLKALSWPVKPLAMAIHEVVARTGRDAFIRSPNDGHPRHPSTKNAGGDVCGPIGTYHSKTGLRYLIRFDVPAAFQQAGLALNEFTPEEVVLIVRLLPTPDARADVPIIVHPLTTPFREGEGEWGKHAAHESGCTWNLASNHIPWKRAGGDFDRSVSGKAVFPASGPAEIEIDVTDLYLPKFALLRESGTWEDFGMILMRDPHTSHQCLYRMIHALESAPKIGIQRGVAQVLSPELVFR